MTIRIPVGLTLTFNQAAIDALGTVSDVKLAKTLGVDRKTVRARRESLGIPVFKPPRRVLEIVCVIDGRITKVVGQRKSRLRLTCPPDHRITRGPISDCQRELIRRTLLARQGTSLKKIPRVPGMRFIGFDAPGLGDD